jgi:hypothetical protein
MTSASSMPSVNACPIASMAHSTCARPGEVGDGVTSAQQWCWPERVRTCASVGRTTACGSAVRHLTTVWARMAPVGNGNVRSTCGSERASCGHGAQSWKFAPLARWSRSSSSSRVCNIAACRTRTPATQDVGGGNRVILLKISGRTNSNQSVMAAESREQLSSVGVLVASRPL